MGMAKLNIWISAMDDPCGVSDKTWYVTIYDCDGNVLQWCGRRYVVMPARCGHLEVEVPPGCYYLKAVWNYHVIVPGHVYHVNHFTDAGIVQACCDQTACIKLFNPSIHRCGRIYVHAIRDLLNQKAIKPEVGKNVIAAVDGVARLVPEAGREFELGHGDEIDELLRKHAKEEKECCDDDK